MLLLLLSCRRRRLKNHQNTKTKIDDESYLEHKLGINFDGTLHGFFAAHLFQENTSTVAFF